MCSLRKLLRWREWRGYGRWLSLRERWQGRASVQVQTETVRNHRLFYPLITECKWDQVSRQERPPNPDKSAQTFQVPVREELQNISGSPPPHHQLPPTRLHWHHPQDATVETSRVPSRPQSDHSCRRSSSSPSTSPTLYRYYFCML